VILDVSWQREVVLDLEHPQSAHVFAASKQIDMILDYAKRISFDDREGRVFMSKVVAPCFAALHWLNENHFDADPTIRQRIDDLQADLDKLAGQPTEQADSPFDRKTCPSCSQQLTTPTQYDPIPYCPRCLDQIEPALTTLRSCEGGFGTEAI